MLSWPATGTTVSSVTTGVPATGPDDAARGAEMGDWVMVNSGGERYASVYNIDYNRCIFCGYCVEACPTDAITHGHGFELASYNTSTLIQRKEDMLAAMPPGTTGKIQVPTEEVAAH